VKQVIRIKLIILVLGDAPLVQVVNDFVEAEEDYIDADNAKV
jgi:hypothetical protein